MSALDGVAGGVTIGRVVTTERGAAGLTGAQMDPAVTAFHTLITDLTLGLLDCGNGSDVGTDGLRGHGASWTIKVTSTV